jgi:uncharacterized protein DUF6328
MVLPGIQALFGFQLISVFTEGFQKLNGSQHAVHFLALIGTAVSATLLMTPAAHHRISEDWRPSMGFLRTSSFLVALAMVVLLTSLSLEMWVVASAIFQEAIAWISSVGLAILGLGLWFLWPWAKRQARRS